MTNLAKVKQGSQWTTKVCCMNPDCNWFRAAIDVVLPTTIASVPADMVVTGLNKPLHIRMLVGVMPQLFCYVCGYLLKDTE